MKNLILALMLVIMGQRWEPSGGPVVQGWCINPPHWTGPDCRDSLGVVQYYRLVYVIGEFKPWPVCSGMGPCGDTIERFTIPVPNTPSKTMSAIEADLRNKDLADPRLRELTK